MAKLAVGSPVRGSKTGRPVMVLLDLLGRRMAMRILWELHDRPLNFRALLAAAETNPSVLNTRLHELRDANLVDLTAAGYQLSTNGSTLVCALLPLVDWSRQWSENNNTPPIDNLLS